MLRITASLSVLRVISAGTSITHHVPRRHGGSARLGYLYTKYALFVPHRPPSPSPVAMPGPAVYVVAIVGACAVGIAFHQVRTIMLARYQLRYRVLRDTDFPLSLCTSPTSLPRLKHGPRTTSRDAGRGGVSGMVLFLRNLRVGTILAVRPIAPTMAGLETTLAPGLSSWSSSQRRRGRHGGTLLVFVTGTLRRLWTRYVALDVIPCAPAYPGS